MAPNQQNLFIIKSVDSASLSQSNGEEKFNIQSYVQNNRRSAQSLAKQRRRAPPPLTSLALRNNDALRPRIQARAHRGVREIESQPDSDSSSDNGSPPTTITLQVPENNGYDPFGVSCVYIDGVTNEMLKYTFSDFVINTFRVESLCPPLPVSQSTSFRHHNSIVKRLQTCVVNPLLMNATLAYGSSCMEWTLGIRSRDKPSEVYISRVLEMIRQQLGTVTALNPNLILAIYALGIAESWKRNLKGAGVHFSCIKHLVAQYGGMNRLGLIHHGELDPRRPVQFLYTLTPPVFDLDWDPGDLPAQRCHGLEALVDFNTSEFGTGFLEIPEVPSELQKISTDMADCIRVAHALWTCPQSTSTEDERWLFLRHHSLMHRLLSLQPVNDTTSAFPASDLSRSAEEDGQPFPTDTDPTALEACLRLTLMITLLDLIPHVGALRTNSHLLPRLQRALCRLTPQDYHIIPTPLMFWIYSTGAMAGMSAKISEATWFIDQVMETAQQQMQMQIRIEVSRDVLGRYMYLELGDGVQLEALVRELRIRRWKDVVEQLA